MTPSRRLFLTGAAGLAGAAAATTEAAARRPSPAASDRIPFRGRHQAGIATPPQPHTYFAALDLAASGRAELIALMRTWSEAADRLANGLPLGAKTDSLDAPGADTGETLGMPPARLTVTFGFGADLFGRAGAERFGLARLRPEALVDLPRFPGDQLVAQRTGGDVSIQACADDPQTAFHAVRQLARLADGKAQIRWVQAGFTPRTAPGETPRNLMGFKDGSMNVPVDDPAAMAQHVWIGPEGGPGLRDGTYMVVRPIRIALEHWDRMKVSFQEQTIGRRKADGAPLGGARESDPLDLDAVDANGEPRLAETAHARLAHPAVNGGAQILRRAYSYDNGVSFVAERWPPWRQGMEYDAGLLFICHQRDPRAGFVRIFERMSRFDMLNQFVTHVGGGLFALPPGAAPGGYVGQALLEA